jgi:hypothetical protein
LKRKDIGLGWSKTRTAVISLVTETPKTFREIHLKLIEYWPFLCNSKGESLIDSSLVIYQVIDDLCRKDIIRPSGDGYRYDNPCVCPVCGR